MQCSTGSSDPHALHTFKHQAVRDLAWCCFSAPLLRRLPGVDATLFPQNERDLWPWLRQMDDCPDALITHLSRRKSTRLGIYYEALWHFYFDQRPEWELLHYNLQVDVGGVTQGAFDFLCRQGANYWHIETAVKFYLCNASDPVQATEWRRWVGPASDDRLDIKLGRLTSHQLPLHAAPGARSALALRYPDAKEWRTGLCLQGYLFSPAGQKWEPAEGHDGHDGHGRGEWWFVNQFVRHLQESAQANWYMLERALWLSPARLDYPHMPVTNLQLAEKITAAIKVQGRPILLAEMNLVQMPNGCTYWAEVRRVFVVPDHWGTTP